MKDCTFRLGRAPSLHEPATTRVRLLTCCVAALLCACGAVFAQSSTAPADTTVARSAKARMAQAESLLPAKTATFNFVDAPINNILAYFTDRYGIAVARQTTLDVWVTMKLPDPLTAKEAMGLLNDTLLPMGYVALESVQGNPPQLSLEIVPTTKDPKAVPAVYMGANPTTIPDVSETRTQVIQLASADPEEVRKALGEMLKQAVIQVSPATGRVYITDSAANIRTAVQAIAILEQHAVSQPDGPATRGRAPASDPATGVH